MSTLQGEMVAASTGASTDAIQAHYDVGEDFYSLWLDESKTYSCALWEREDESLQSAQRRKLDYIASLAGAQGSAHVLDVGCGWGSMIRHLLDCGVGRVTGVSLSPRQIAHIKAEADDRVNVALCDWRDLDLDGPVDAIVSIGAFEHFARTDISVEEKRDTYRQFFTRCHQWLKPGGRIGLQTITYENSTREDFSDFFRTEVFPESDLPTLSDLTSASEHLFEVTELRSDREHYARTTRAWLRGLRAHKERAIELTNEATVARFEKYLQLATVGFHVGSMGLVRLGLRRIDNPRTPV